MGSNMKKLILIAVALAVTGCSNSHKDGTCAIYVYGSCMAKYINGEKIPSGDVDIRFNGLQSDSDGNFSGKVSVKSREW